MKKLTIDQVKARCFKVHGDRYEYDWSTYTGTASKVRIICPTHGEFWQLPSNHFKGKGCVQCSGKTLWTTETFIAKSREVHGAAYRYDKVVYKSNNAPVIISCLEHGDFQQRPATHMLGGGCPKCAGVQKLTQNEFIERASSKHGGRYDYSQSEYVNQQTKLTVVCTAHGAFQITAGNHLSGKGCPRCVSNKPMTNEEFIKKAIAVHGDRFDYSAVEYVRSQQKVTVICKDHGPFEQTPNNHLNGMGCKKCALTSGVLKMTHDEFLVRAREIHGDKYEYIGTYVDTDTHLLMRCPTHGEFMQRPEKHLAGQGCKSCSHSGPSAGQIEVTEFLRQFVTVESEVKEADGMNTSLDIFIPEHNLAVEYHGLIWHSERFNSNPKKDYEKHVRCTERGIRVIHIYEDEWELKQDVVKQMLLSAINLMPSVMARKCSVIEIDKEQAREFFDVYHIQGGRANKLNLGLIHHGELVAVMGFDVLGSVRTNIDDRKWELTRYASICRVSGGAGKLVSAFKAMNLCNELVSYSDNRMFSGEMYRTLGFEFVHETPPDYWYTTGRIDFGRKHKRGYQKSRLKAMFPESYSDDKTEHEICLENKLYRIYDCGKKKWMLNM